MGSDQLEQEGAFEDRREHVRRQFKTQKRPSGEMAEGLFWSMVVGEGFEPSKALPSDLQSDLVDRLSTPPYQDLVLGAGFEPAQP